MSNKKTLAVNLNTLFKLSPRAKKHWAASASSYKENECLGREVHQIYEEKKIAFENILEPICHWNQLLRKAPKQN